ncbi:MAG: hypothetical protein M1821_006919 [Bathelium mastoideum]|nr:MAG: hypothetical protein M1821_006919 [Bathelium mastoideum]
MHTLLIRILLFLLPFSAFAAFSPAEWGFALEESISNYIVSSVTTVQVPTHPVPNDGLRYLWPGTRTNQNDALIQSVLCAGPDKCIAPCHHGPDQWCIFPAVNVSGSFLYGESVIASSGDLLTIEHSYDASSGEITQRVSRAGDVITSYAGSFGAPIQYHIRFECHDAPEDILMLTTVYSNTTLTFDQPVNLTSKVEYGDALTTGLETTDGNKQWSVEEINFQDSECEGS